MTGKMNFKSIAVAGMLSVIPVTTQAQPKTVENMLEWDVNPVNCLALNMYHEAGDQGTAGILAVSAVVLNKSDTPHNKKKYKKILDLSKAILYNEISYVDITDGALFYHADHITPGWAKTKQRTTEIGDHIFYTWRVK